MAAPDDDCEPAGARDAQWRAQMRAAQDGDQSTYGALLAEMLPILRLFVRRKWGNAQDVDDIVQDILLSLHAVRHTYGPSRPFLPWLLTIAYRRKPSIDLQPARSETRPTGNGNVDLRRTHGYG